MLIIYKNLMLRIFLRAVPVRCSTDKSAQHKFWEAAFGWLLAIDWDSK
jgi:hypothetical protein